MKRIETLYNEYNKKIYNYFYFLTYNSFVSQELTQETFYQAVLSIPKYKETSKISTWLYGIARNTYLKYLRDEKKNHLQINEEIKQDNPISTPEEEMMRFDRIQAIRKCISQLSENHKTVLVLRDRENLSYQEVARITGLTVSNVKVTLHRARNQFKQIYEKYERGERI